MAESFHVRIDVLKVQSNLTAAGDPLTEQECHDWRVEEGFRPEPDGWWLCEEITMDILDPSEIVEWRPV